MSFLVEVTGEYALFSRPELKVERYSYDVITPSAARGILEAVFWKPAIKYTIDRIFVLNPIRETNIRRNEIGGKLSANIARQIMGGSKTGFFVNTKASIQQRASRVLKDVHYIIEARFDLTDKAGPEDTEEKFYNMILRRLRKGQCFHQPYLGCREFPARVSLYEDSLDSIMPYTQNDMDLGLMLYDMDYYEEGATPSFFRAKLSSGVIDLRECEVIR